MHGHILGGSFVTFELDDDADARAVQIGSQLAAIGKMFEAAKAHVLANLADQAFAYIFQCRAKAILGIGQGAQSSHVNGAILGNQFSSRIGERQKAVVFGDEVGFAVDFKQSAHTAADEAGDHALCGDATCSLAGFAAQLDTQQFLGFGHIAFGLGQSAFALHHGRVGFAAQFSHHACGNCSHFHSP